MTKKDALKKLNTLLEKSNNLPDYQPNNNQEYDKWYRKVEDTFEQIPNITKYSIELQNLKFEDNSVQQAFDKAWEGTAELNKYNKSIKDLKALIETVIDNVEEWDEHVSYDLKTTKYQDTTVSVINITNNKPKTKVFIVHGHDNGAKQEVARFLEKLGLEPIILHEQANGGTISIIDKIEEYAKQVDFGIVLYTACDEGKAKGESELKNRARQNVVFEHGYLIGLLGKNKVCSLKKGNIETHSDLSGVVYTSMDDNGSWHLPLAKELKAAGYIIDPSKLF